MLLFNGILDTHRQKEMNELLTFRRVQTCHKCHGNNHFAKMCRFKTPTTAYSQPRIHEVHKEESTDEYSSHEAGRTVHRKNYENNSQERINYEPQGQRQKCEIQN